MLGKVNEAAALGVDRTPAECKFTNRGRRARVLRKLGRMELRIPTTDVEPIQVGRQRIPDRRELDQFATGLRQQFQVVGVVEAKRLVAGDADPNARLRRGELQRRRPPVGPRGGEAWGSDDVIYDQIRNLVDR